MKRTILILIAVGCLSGLNLAAAQAHNLRPGGGEHRPAPPDPLMFALDADHNGELSAEEIANASTTLKSLDTNADGKLTPDEVHPSAARQGERNAPPVHQNRRPAAQGRLDPPPTAALVERNARPDRLGHSRSPDNCSFGPPPSPMMLALDTDRNGELSGDEIANAAKVLKKLDTNADGKLTPEEVPPPLPRPAEKERPDPPAGRGAWAPPPPGHDGPAPPPPGRGGPHGPGW